MTGAASMARALTIALRKVDLSDASAAAVALAKRYAMLLDRSSARASYRRDLTTVARALDGASDEVREAFQRITDALGEHSVASDLGPKLLASLAALGLTVPVTGKDHGNGSPAAASRDELRARRAARTDRAKAVDTATH